MVRAPFATEDRNVLFLQILLVVKNILNLASLVERDGRPVQQILDVSLIIRGWIVLIGNYRLLTLQ